MAAYGYPVGGNHTLACAHPVYAIVGELFRGRTRYVANVRPFSGGGGTRAMPGSKRTVAAAIRSTSGGLSLLFGRWRDYWESGTFIRRGKESSPCFLDRPEETEPQKTETTRQASKINVRRVNSAEQRKPAEICQSNANRNRRHDEAQLRKNQSRLNAPEDACSDRQKHSANDDDIAHTLFTLPG
jgi:hypothetical protein